MRSFEGLSTNFEQFEPNFFLVLIFELGRITYAFFYASRETRQSNK